MRLQRDAAKRRAPEACRWGKKTMAAKYSIAVLFCMVLSTHVHATDNNLRVARVRHMISENVLTNVAMPGNPNPVVQSNGYRKMTFYLGARIADRVVSAVNLDTHSVDLSDGTNNLNLIVIPGVHTNLMADIVSLSARSYQRVAIGDRLTDGLIVTQITTNDEVVAESALSGQVIIPFMTQIEEQELKKPQHVPPVQPRSGAH